MERVWEVFADAWNILLNELFVNDAVPVALTDIGTAVARAYDDCGCRHLHVDYLMACLGLIAWDGMVVGLLAPLENERAGCHLGI